MLGRHSRGDTLVEVILAFAVFTLVSVGAITVMNRGVAMSERSLEVTLVREQIDAQAEILRYARDTQSSVWTNDIRSNLATSPGDRCPDAPPSRAFIASTNGGAVTHKALNAASFQKPTTYSQFTLGADPHAYGMWVVPVSAGTDAYDMYIYACWYAPGDSEPMTLGTIVRLYET